MKEYNVKRHYETQHKMQYEEYHGKTRIEIADCLKREYQKQKKVLSSFIKPQTTSTVATYEIALMLLRKSKSYRDGELVKQCAIKMAHMFEEDKVARKFETVSLSHQTIARRVSDLGKQVSLKLKNIVENCVYFSLALDESTDISDTSELLIFIRTVDVNFTVQEELVKVCSLNEGTKGSNIYAALESVIHDYGGYEKCSCIVTDGAKAMTGNNTGLVGLLKKNGINCITLHCIIHQQALCGKMLQTSDVMKTVVQIVNLIRSGNKAHRHRRFITFLEELNAEFSDLPLYTNVRWLSAGKVLKHFFGLRKDILSFLTEESSETHVYQTQLSDENFLCKPAFLTDITMHLNVMNLRLQGRNQNISHLVGHVETFKIKLHLFATCLKNNDLSHFDSLHELLADDVEVECSRFVEDIEALSHEFENRFQDFDRLKPNLYLYNNPMDVNVETQLPEFQLELCELQCDPFLLSRKNEIQERFWKLVSKDKFPKLKNFALKMHSMFGSTYVCESTFSTMQLVKSRNRNRMANQTLDNCLRLATTSIDIDIETIVQKNPQTHASH